MGRPPLKRDAKVRQQTIWLHQDMIDRIVARVGSQGISAFMRRAAEAQLIIDEAASAPPPVAPKRQPSIDDLFNDDD